MQHRPPEYKPGARGVAVGVHRCHRGLCEPPLPRRRFSTKSSIALAKGVKRDRITWLSLPAIPEEPKNLFLELTGSRVSLPLYQKGEEGLAVMGLRKAATLLGSLGNVSKGCARGRDRCSAPFASVSPEVVTSYVCTSRCARCSGPVGKTGKSRPLPFGKDARRCCFRNSQNSHRTV